MTKRITGIIHNLALGGAEKNFGALFNHLCTKGYDCSIVCLAPTTDHTIPISSNIKIITLAGDSSILKLPKLINQLRTALLSINPDCIVSFMDQTNILTLWALPKASNIPVIVCERNNPARNLILGRRYSKLFQSIARYFRNIIYARASIICTQTAGAAQYFKTHMPAVKTVIIHNFVDSIVASNSQIRKPIITSVARLVPEKGLATLIRSFTGTLKRHPDWRLEIYGEGPEEGLLNSLINTLAVENSVRLMGKSQDLRTIYEQTSIFALNSSYEGFPNALLEAMASGCAVIARDCDYGPRELIVDGINGLLLRPEHEEDLGQKLEELMSSEKLRGDLSQQARQVSKQFSLSRFQREFEETILGLC